MKLRASLSSALLILVTTFSTAHAQLHWDINGANAGATDDAGGLAPGTWDCCGGSAADYNGDGIVDTADYIAWRKDPANFGGDPNGYNAWVLAFNESGGGGGTANWSTDATGASATVGWTPGETAVFSAGTNATTTAVTVSGTQSVGGITFQDGTVTLSGGQLDLTGAGTLTTASGTTSTINSVIGGTVALTKAGADRLLLGGANVYSGGTNINAGTLQFANTNAMPSSGAVIVANTATLSVNAGGAGEWTAATSGGGSIGGLIAGVGGQGTVDQVTWSDGSRLGVDTTNAAGGLLAYSGVIGSFRAAAGTTNAVGLTKRGPGTLELSGANTYTGPTTLTAAPNPGAANILKLSATNTLPSATVLTLPGSNGNARVELYDAGNVSKDQTIAGLAGGGTGTTGPTVVDVGFAQLTLNIPTGQSNTYNGFLKTDFDQTDANHVGKVVMNGPGELILGGNNNDTTNRFAGQFIANGGRVGFANSVPLGPSAATGGTSRLIINNGATFFKANAAATSATVNTRYLDINGSFTIDMTGAESDFQFLPGTAAQGGATTLNANATITVTSPVDPSFPTNTPLGFTPAFILAGSISDGANSFSLTKAGPGLLTLNRVNDYSGGTTISEGTLRLAAAANDATVPSTMGTGPVTLAGGNLQYTGALINGVRKLTINNPVTMTASSTISLRSGTGASGLSTTGVDFEFSDFTATAGTLTLLNNGNSNEPAFATPTVNPVEFRVGFTGSSLSFAQPIVISNHPTVANRTTMLVGANSSGTQTFSGVISGNGGVIRNGGGTTILSGINTYTGNTVIDAGTLSITNPYLADTADVLFVSTGTGSPIFDLNTSGATDTIDQLFIDGVSQGPGTYGFGALNPGGLFTGSGFLLVTALGSGGAVPEPGTFALAMMALCALGVHRHRRG